MPKATEHPNAYQLTDLDTVPLSLKFIVGDQLKSRKTSIAPVTTFHVLSGFRAVDVFTTSTKTLKYIPLSKRQSLCCIRCCESELFTFKSVFSHNSRDMWMLTNLTMMDERPFVASANTCRFRKDNVLVVGTRTFSGPALKPRRTREMTFGHICASKDL